MTISVLIRSSVAAIALIASSTALAATTYTGSDDGTGPGGPFANSSTAQALFLADAATFGAVVSDGFEAAPLGHTGSVALAAGASITSASPNFGDGFSGVSVTTFGGLFGFNTTVGGAKWFGFPDQGPATATISFGSATNSFGFWTTGVQTNFTSAITLTQIDGSQLVFSLPINSNGGANFFGVTDMIGFTSVTLTLNSTGDAWGVDDFSYNGVNGGVPEASTWMMLIAGFGLVGAAARRRKMVAA